MSQRFNLDSTIEEIKEYVNSRTHKQLKEEFDRDICNGSKEQIADNIHFSFHLQRWNRICKEVPL